MASGAYSILQVFRPGNVATLSANTSIGATSFTLSSVTGMSVSDTLVIDTDSTTTDYLTIATVNAGTNTVTTSSGAVNAHTAGVNVFRPGAFTKTPGTPNLLLDTELDANTGTSRGCYQATWKWLQQGGLDQGTFYLHKTYEDNANIEFGNWIVFGTQGGILASPASAGASTLSLTNTDYPTNLSTGASLQTIQNGDAILISDGVNSELFIASTFSGGTVTLGAAPGVYQSTLLNSYAAGTKVVRLCFQGIIQAPHRSTRMDNVFQVTASGMFIRYGQALGNSFINPASPIDGATLISDLVNGYATTLPEIVVSGSTLASSSIPVVVNEQDARLSAIFADIIKQECSNTQISTGTGGTSHVPATLTFQSATAPTQKSLFSSSVLPITASSSNTAVATVTTSGHYVVVQPVGAGTCTITSTDTNSHSATFTVIVKNAPAFGGNEMWAVWVDEQRQVHHGKIPIGGTPTKTLDITNASNANGDYVSFVERIDDGSNIINAAVVRGGNDANGNPLRVVVLEKNSRKWLNAWYEGTLDNTDISNEQQLANWAASQLAIVAYPVTTATVQLACASMRIGINDLLQISGFSDGSSFLVNPLEIDYVADAKNQGIVTGVMNVGILRPHTDDVAAQNANGKPIRERYNQTPVNLTQGFIVSGLGLTVGSGNSFSIAAGTISYGGTNYSVSASGTLTAPSGTSQWGVQVSGGVASIVQMPTASTLSGQAVNNSYSVTYRGGPAVADTTFAGVPLHRVFANSTTIRSTQQIGPSGGTGISNLRRSADTSDGIVDSNTNVLHTLMSGATQNTVQASAGADGSNLKTGVVSNRTVMSTTVQGTQVYPATYSTQQLNTSQSPASSLWATTQTGGSAITAGTTLTNGQAIYYNTGSGSYGGTSAPAQTSYLCPASGSITAVFSHVAYASGGYGAPRISFSGTTGGGSSSATTSSVSGSQNVTWGGSVHSPTPTYGQSNGTAQNFTVSTAVAPDATHALNLNLSSVSCPSDTDGSSSLTITLTGPSGVINNNGATRLTISGSGTIVTTGTTTSVTGVTAATTITYAPSSGGQGVGNYTWNIQAIANNNNVAADVPYSSTYTVSFSGTAQYWQTTGGTGQTYVLAADGVTKRTSTLDANVQLVQVTPGQFGVVIYNSDTSARSFSIGMDVSGV